MTTIEAPEARESPARAPREVYQSLMANMRQVIHGQEAATRKLVTAFASGGHVLLEDYPGTGKTTMAKVLAKSIDTQFKRIQFTPDLLPSDILGVSVFNQRSQDFQFHPGPIFTNILLADEINRASPRTQSALLEAMGEGQVTFEGQKRQLPPLFFVIATQNPVEFRGTYPLPEAQMDRFAMQFDLGYVSPDVEVEILTSQQDSQPLDAVVPCVSMRDVLDLQTAVRAVRISTELKSYIVTLVSATRGAPGVLLGASPRASLSLMRAAQALSLFDGMEYVTPDHVKEIAASVIAHRLVMQAQARFSGATARGIVEQILKQTPVPA